MCLIKLLLLFSFISHYFWGTYTAFPNNINLLFLPNNVVLRLCSNLSGFDAALLAYPSRTNLTEDSV